MCYSLVTRQVNPFISRWLLEAFEFFFHEYVFQVQSWRVYLCCLLHGPAAYPLRPGSPSPSIDFGVNVPPLGCFRVCSCGYMCVCVCPPAVLCHRLAPTGSRSQTGVNTTRPRTRLCYISLLAVKREGHAKLISTCLSYWRWQEPTTVHWSLFFCPHFLQLPWVALAGCTW